MIESIYRDYYEALLDTDKEKAIRTVERALQGGITPEAVIFDVVVPAMEELADVVKHDVDTTLAQHFVASRIAAEVTERLLPQFSEAPDIVGHVVLGTAREDFHGLGKNIVTGCLAAKMIRVTDLGLNVSPERFLDEALECGAHVIGVSSMMVHTARGEEGPLRIRELIRERGVEDRVKLAVGGAPYRFNPDLYKTVGADGWAENGARAAGVIEERILEVKRS